jgi:hypothetical protein
MTIVTKCQRFGSKEKDTIRHPVVFTMIKEQTEYWLVSIMERLMSLK